MATILVKSEERKRDEQYVMHSFHVRPGDAAAKEAAECIAARSREAYTALRKMEEKHR